MKKSFVLLLTAIIYLGATIRSEACTNLLVSKGASKDGSTMITYNADAGGFMEPLYFHQGGKHKKGDSIPIYDWDSHKYLGKIAQAAETYSVIGHINEWQVSIGETTFGGRKELRDTNGIIDYGSLMTLALQRSKTAREAIKVMGELVAEYGYYSSGESISIADPNEVWIMEIIGKGGKEKGAVWVALKVPDGYICAHANQARIRTFPLNDPENCIYTPDIIDFAVKQGYYKPGKEPFSFVDAYCPLDPGSLMFCEGRVWSIFRRAAPSQTFSPEYFMAVKGAEPYPLFVKPDNKISVQDAIALIRDHFNGTEFDMTKGVASEPFGNPYRWKNLTFKIDGDTNQYGWERPISTQQTAFSFVMQMRSWLPREIGGIMWYGVDDNYSTVYVPLYCSIKSAPETFTVGSISEFTLESGFWVFNLVANLAYTKYSYIIKDIQKVQSELENKFFAFQPALESAALELHKTSPDLCKDYLTEYSINQSNITVNRWRELWSELVVKYNDGYINDVNIDHGRSPKGVGYGDSFFKRVIADKPGYFNVHWRDKDWRKKATKKR